MLKVRRRGVLQIAGVAVAAGSFGCAPRSSVRFLDDGERAVLEHLANLILPPDDTPGAVEVGAVDYIDALLAGDALYFASGPFSGRTPFPDAQGLPSTDFPDNAFVFAEPVDRVQHEAMRRFLYGTPGGADGVRARMRAGLASSTTSTQLEALDPDFLDLLIQLVSEGAFSAPEYGGNTNGSGWRMCHYEGDAMPFGFANFDSVAGVYRERPGQSVSKSDDLPDPDPLDDDVRTLLDTAVNLLGGRVIT